MQIYAKSGFESDCFLILEPDIEIRSHFELRHILTVNAMLSFSELSELNIFKHEKCQYLPPY